MAAYDAAMPPRKRRLTRDERKAQTRSDLLRAASRLFVRNGFVATSLSDIAEEAALTKGAVYSNFDSKEELFLALLQETARPNNEARQEETAPSDLSAAIGDTPEERAAAWGRAIGGRRRTRKNVALFLEMNAVALRSDRARAWVSQHNQEFFKALGQRLADVLDAPDADPAVLGLIAQSLYVGLMTHEAFGGSAVDEDVFAQAYRLMAHLTHDNAADRA